MRPSIYWQIGLQDRQCHALCTLGKTSRCWLDLCFHDKDLAHCLVKQARDHLWLNKTLPNIWKIFTICSILFYQNLVKSLQYFCQIFNKNLNQQLIQWYNEQIQFWHILAEWSILGKTRRTTPQEPASGILSIDIFLFIIVYFCQWNRWKTIAIRQTELDSRNKFFW